MKKELILSHKCSLELAKSLSGTSSIGSARTYSGFASCQEDCLIVCFSRQEPTLLYTSTVALSLSLYIYTCVCIPFLGGMLLAATFEAEGAAEVLT